MAQDPHIHIVYACGCEEASRAHGSSRSGLEEEKLSHKNLHHDSHVGLLLPVQSTQQCGLLKHALQHDQVAGTTSSPPSSPPAVEVPIFELSACSQAPKIVGHCHCRQQWQLRCSLQLCRLYVHVAYFSASTRSSACTGKQIERAAYVCSPKTIALQSKERKDRPQHSLGMMMCFQTA